MVCVFSAFFVINSLPLDFALKMDFLGNITFHEMVTEKVGIFSAFFLTHFFNSPLFAIFEKKIMVTK